eukprot:3425-Heterococcus_DN1.PRE.2
MNDRLSDLRRGSTAAVGQGEVELTNVVIDVRPEVPDEQKESMKTFFENVELIKADINSVKAACKQLDVLTEAAIFNPVDKAQFAAVCFTKAMSSEYLIFDALRVTTCDCEQGGASAKDRINTLIAATNKHVAHAKALLQAMRDETAAMKKDPKKGSSANTRVRENLLNTFTRKFVDVAKEYQVKGKAERAIKAVKPAATEEEMTAVFAQEDGVTRVLEAAVMQQSGDPVEVANVVVACCAAIASITVFKHQHAND